MRKSNWKLNYIAPSFFKQKWLKKPLLNLSTFRNSSIFSSLVGKRAQIYNGAWFLTKQIEGNMIKSKIGEFALTKTYTGQTQKKRKTKRKTKKLRVS